VNRRAFVTGLGAVLAAPLAAEEERGVVMPRIGYLTPSSQSRGIVAVDVFREGLREHGYIDGRNVVIDSTIALQSEEVVQSVSGPPRRGRQTDAQTSSPMGCNRIKRRSIACWTRGSFRTAVSRRWSR
jgi:hypothetical protein